MNYLVGQRMNKSCKQCGEQLKRKTWYGTRIRVETNKRWHERQYCDNSCRSQALRELPSEENYFFKNKIEPWNKGKRNTIKIRQTSGYVRVFAPDRSWKYEHRLVVEKDLGRVLRSDEVIHHMDGDKANNSLDNLLLTNQADHRKYHADGKVR